MFFFDKDMCDKYGQYVGTLALGVDKTVSLDSKDSMILVAGVKIDDDGTTWMGYFRFSDIKYTKLDNDNMIIIARDAENDKKILGI